MAASAPIITDVFEDDLERFTAKRNEPAVISALRRLSLARFEELGLPGSRQEAWRFTDLGNLSKTRFKRAGDVPMDANRLPPPAAEHSHRLVFVNGRFAPGLSHLQAFPSDALVASLGHALRTHPELVEAYLGRLAGLEDNAFTALNSAFWEDGAFVYLPKGTTLDDPLHLIFLASGNDTVNYPRNLIIVGAAAQATVVEDYRGDGAYLSCPVTEIVCGDGAVLQHHKIQDDAPQSHHLGGLRLRQGRDSTATLHFASSGALLTRTDIFALLDGSGADCTLNGLTLVEDGQLGDYHIRVEHAKPHGSSRQWFRGVVNGKSRAVFDGLIKVHKDAQKTDASQNNRNLLLSRQALADSNPRLEILADDVKCSHGSTVGFLDENALFYLRSRGIGEDQARAMLIYAFANECIERIRLAPLRERLEQGLVARLYPTA